MKQTASPAGVDQGDPWSTPASVPRRPLQDYREADRKIYEILLQEGFQGPKQELLETRLTAYVWQLLRVWIVTGEIYNRVRAIGRPVNQDPMLMQLLQSDPGARDDLALDTITTAFPLFRVQLKEGKWDSSLGTLTTYFIGSVIRSFPNAYRGWVRRQTIDARAEPMGVTPEELSVFDMPRTENDVGSSIENQEIAEYFFRLLKSPDREVAQMVYEGAPISEIATQFNVTTEAIRRRLHRMRDTAILAGLEAVRGE